MSIYLKIRRLNADMKKYISPLYIQTGADNAFDDFLGLSLELIPEDNSVIITQDAEQIFG
jgi:hypothetical protein